MKRTLMPACYSGTAVLLSFLTLQTHGQTLRIDFDERPNIVTAPGYNSFVLDPASGNAGTAVTTARTFTLEGANPITLSLSGVSSTGAAANVDDRIRTTPANSGDFTLSEIYRDFVFYSADRAEGSGIRLEVSGLVPSSEYAFTLYSFDTGSTGTRVADWSANDILVRDNYTFSGSVLPTSNDQYSFSFNAAADQNGLITILGTRDATSLSSAAAADFGVFINGLELTVVPEPGTFALLGLGAAALACITRQRRR